MLLYYIGIDPGTSGALAVYTRTNDGPPAFVTALDLPVTVKKLTNGKKRKRIDAPALYGILRQYHPIASITVEDVHARPNEGAVNAFSFGHTLGAVEAVARIVCENVTQITPQRWKAAYGLTADKGEARSLAQSLTGDQKRFRRVKDADAAEATLMALYGALGGNVSHQGKAA